MSYLLKVEYEKETGKKWYASEMIMCGVPHIPYVDWLERKLEEHIDKIWKIIGDTEGDKAVRIEHLLLSAEVVNTDN